ncbi:hypothetical protein IC617_08955 [Neiella sp. HB171785]|uniref:Uncharacterized protein n=1 Tax=Neiella litorisoli TaxID=2771431 RepID=A0A8J6QQP9_9GAMM|nr:hypothetical protein [Neiella litorisoli]MBD1389556.1 hypothetical protein [Neiella litorisoli]
MRVPLPESLLNVPTEQPLPKRPDRIKDYEPTEFELHRIRKCMEECRCSELSDNQMNWMCYVLIPTIMKYGRYPIPDLKVVV